jgi:hypothetical protein
MSVSAPAFVFVYCCRKAAIGFTFEARRAGMPPARP